LTGVHSLVGDESFCAELESVGVTEGDFGERCTTTGVMNDFLDYTTEISMSFCVLQLDHELNKLEYIQNSELGSTLSETSVGLEDASRLSRIELASGSLEIDALSAERIPLGTDNSTHLKIEMMVV
jgi:hypothetical protein